MKTYRQLLLVISLLALVVSACGSDSSPAGGGVTVVATTGIIGDVAGAVVGDRGQVQVLMPAGADPHEFSPSPEQVAALQEADLVIANGLGLEAGMIDVLESAAAEGANLLELAPQLDPLPLTGDHEHEEDEHEEGEHEEGEHEEGEHEEGETEGHDHGGEDPHFWLDPVRMADAADLIASALAEAVPDAAWGEAAATYRAEIEALHAEIEEALEPIPAGQRKLVTNHDAVGYFAHRYGFEVVDTVIPGGSTLAEPSAAELSELVETLRTEEVTAIFADTSSSASLAEAAAAELGESVQVYELYTEALGGEGSGAETYLEMMRANAAIIAGALGH